MSRRGFRGPIEDGRWPEGPTARVVTPGSEPRIRGYAVDDDLALHAGFAERVWLTFAGELPEPRALRVFEATLAFASPAHVGEAPTGAAVAARLAGGRRAGFIQSAVVVLGEQAQRFDEIAAALASTSPGEPLPEALEPGDDEDPERVETFARVVAAIEGGVEPRWDGFGPMAALADAWMQLGFRRPEVWIALWIQARIPAVVAEALYVRPGMFHLYPMNTPIFVYEEDEA